VESREARQPVWSNTVWRHIIRTYLRNREAVAIVDLHTGLGPHGSEEIIFRASFAGDGYSRARRWYGMGVTRSDDQTSSSTQIHGNVHSAVEDEIGNATLTAVTLEFGTLNGLAVLNALRGQLAPDMWLSKPPLGSANKGWHFVMRSIVTTMSGRNSCSTGHWKLRGGAFSGLEVDPSG